MAGPTRLETRLEATRLDRLIALSGYSHRMFIQTSEFCSELGERMELSGYTDVKVYDSAVHARRPQREILIHVWEEGALTVVFKQGSDRGLHLNYWRASPEKNTVTDMWDQFWKHELENNELERLLWMHGPFLKEPELPVPEPEDDGDDDFSMFG